MGPLEFQLEGYQLWAEKRTGLRVQFVHYHVQDTMLIVEEFIPTPPALPPIWHVHMVGGPPY